MKFPLYSPNIVIFYVIRNGSDETVLSFKLSTVIHLSLEYSPEAFHRAVVYTMSNPRHAVDASMPIHKHIELRSCILESSVAMA